MRPRECVYVQRIRFKSECDLCIINDEWHGTKPCNCILGYIESLYRTISGEDVRLFLFSLLFSFVLFSFFSFFSFFFFFLFFFPSPLSPSRVIVVSVKAPPLRPELPGCICNTVRSSRERCLWYWCGRKVVFVNGKAYMIELISKCYRFDEGEGREGTLTADKRERGVSS